LAQKNAPRSTWKQPRFGAFSLVPLHGHFVLVLPSNQFHSETTLLPPAGTSGLPLDKDVSLRKSLFLFGANSLFLTLAPFQPFSLPPPSPGPPFSSLRGPDTGTHIGADLERRSHPHLCATLRLHLRGHSSSIDVSHVHFDALAGSISMLHIGSIMQVRTCIHAIMALNQSQYSTVLNNSTGQLFRNIYCSDMPPQEWASASDACTAA